jgi:predicted PurR-regulated permease PerM
MEQSDRAHNKMTIDISTRSLLRVIMFGVLIVLIIKLKTVILIILTSIVITSFVEHVVKKLEPKKIPRPVTVVTLYLIGLSLLVLISFVIVPIFVQELSSLVDFIGNIFKKTTFFNSIPLNTFQDTKDFFSQFTPDASSTELIRNTQIFLGKISSGLGDTIGSLFGGILNIVMVGVISFYLSIQEKGVENFLRIIMPLRYEEYAISLWKRTQRKIGFWVQGQLLLGLIVATILFVGLSIIGVKYALLLALIAGLSELIPYGLLLAFIPAIGVAFAEGSFKLAGLTLILYTVVQQIENYVIVPLIVRRSTGISPLVVIIALFSGGTLFGFWGILLAVPVVVLLTEYLSDLQEDKLAYLKKTQQP